ncbi:hypothetical protein KCP73_15945 [Salmonella enterica subsp. enterica]|nr:hypothetical protein KCP73_15945 [Salmonella enterica subsp. enterica]
MTRRARKRAWWRYGFRALAPGFRAVAWNLVFQCGGIAAAAVRVASSVRGAYGL